jgi:hypothetical protein
MLIVYNINFMLASFFSVLAARIIFIFALFLNYFRTNYA